MCHPTINAQGTLVDAVQNISSEGSASFAVAKITCFDRKGKTPRTDKSERLAI